MSSYSSPHSSYMSPGWNDPPTLSGDRRTVGNRLLAMKHRRPVDPSIQGHYALSNSSSQPQVFNDRFAPRAESAHLISSMMSTPQSHSPTFAHGQTSASFPGMKQFFDEQHKPIYDAFTVASASYQQPFDFAQLRPQLMHENGVALPVQQNFADPQNSCMIPQNTMFSNMVAPQGPPIESDPKALIYTPPNMIDENLERPITCPAHYVAPVKAAGDVSLNGVQLFNFLTKATLRLPPGVTRDGIQLRISQFHELASLNRVTEMCIKKLNFVIDAIDRESYQEAQQFFEQLLTLFPDETKTSWVQGLRLLIAELRKPTRSGSAGAVRHY